MAESKREYQAMFVIGAKLLGSFKGVMSQAKARLSELAKTAKSFGGLMKGVGIALAGSLAAVAGTILGVIGHSIWSLFKKIWDDAANNAEQAADRQRTLLAYLRQDADFRKKGNAFMENQINLLDQHNAKLSEQTGMSEDIYGEVQKTMVQYGAMPHTLAEMTGPMGDVLAAIKGPRASMQDMAGLADQVGNAIVGGPIRQLIRMGVLEEGVKKDWTKMSQAARFKEILKGMKKFEGEAKRAMDTPVGRMVKFQNAMDKLSNSVGEVLLPAMGDVADMWRGIVETPAFRGAMMAGARAFAGLQKAIAEYTLNTLIPAFNKLAENPAWASMTDAAGKFFSFIGKELATLPEEFAKMWENTLPELEVLLTAMSAISDKALPALQAVIKMRSDLAMRKAGMGAAAIPPEALIAPTKAFKPDVSPAGLLPKEVTRRGEAMDQLFDVTKLKPAIETQKTMFERWGAFGGELIDINSKIGASIDETIANPMGKANEVWGQFKTDMSGMGQAVLTELSGVGTIITNSLTQPIRDAATAWSGLKNAMSGGLPAVAAPTPTPAPVPQAQFGGIFNKPTIAQIGEAGPEAVIPLPRGMRALGAGGATHLNFAPVVTINGNATDEEQRSMDTRLRDLAKDFIAQFKAAQYQERRLSYESGYG